MIEITRKQDCCGCFACENICPTDAISMVSDEEGFWYPQVEASKCISCEQCVRVCPELTPAPISQQTEALACYRKDLEKRMESASGGIFSVLAEQVIAQGGCVFGAAFDGQWALSHFGADSCEELDRLKGSKYIQSRIGSAYRDVRSALKNNRKVLFSGTPCQVQGLKNFLGRDYPNLLTVDLVCHGVPSPEVWKQYLAEISAGKHLAAITPRDKKNGIQNAPIVFRFDDGSEHRENYLDNPYLKGFIHNLYVRPSCFECRFKGIERCSDITIGDFWGLEQFAPDFCDPYGISLVLLHTENGRTAFSAVEDKIAVHPASANQACKENPCLLRPIARTEKRAAFFHDWKKSGVSKTVIRLTRPTFRQNMQKLDDRVRHGLWRIKHRLLR